MNKKQFLAMTLMILGSVKAMESKSQNQLQDQPQGDGKSKSTTPEQLGAQSLNPQKYKREVPPLSAATLKQLSVPMKLTEEQKLIEAKIAHENHIRAFCLALQRQSSESLRRESDKKCQTEEKQCENFQEERNQSSGHIEDLDGQMADLRKQLQESKQQVNRLYQDLEDERKQWLLSQKRSRTINLERDIENQGLKKTLCTKDKEIATLTKELQASKEELHEQKVQGQKHQRQYEEVLSRAAVVNIGDQEAVEKFLSELQIAGEKRREEVDADLMSFVDETNVAIDASQKKNPSASNNAQQAD